MKKKRDVSEYTPMNDQVIVKIIKERSVTKGGILVPDSVGYTEKGGDPDFYKVEIVKYTAKALEINPGLKDHKYGIVSIFTGSYLMTEKDSYKSVPAFMIVAVCDDSFSINSLKPTANRILVKEEEKLDSTESGIFVGKDYSDPREKDTLEGKVLRVGPLTEENLTTKNTAIYDPYVGNILPRLEDVEDHVNYKVVHEHDITVVY